MPAGAYRHKLTVEQVKSDASAGDDGHVDLTDDDNWEAADTIKGRFISKGGREGRIFDQVEAEVTDIVETPSSDFSRSIHPKQRIKDTDGVKYNISAAYDVDRQRKVVRLELVKVT